MAVNTQEFKIKISVEDGVTSSIKGVTHSAEEGISVLGKLGVSTVYLNQALELAKKAYDAVAVPVKEAIDQYVEQERAVNKLSAALRLVGQETASHLAVFQEFAARMEETANVADEVTLNLAAMAKASGLSDAQTKQLIQTSADFAAVTDKDVVGAFRELIGQYSGVMGRAAKFVPELAQFTDAQIKAGDGIRYLSEHLKGFAEQDANSLDGAFKKASVAAENFMKAIGKAIVEATGLGDILKGRAETFKMLTKLVEEMTPKIVAMGTAFRSIDWAKIAEGILAVAAAVVVLKSAGLVVYAYQAIAAIGGLSAAVAAMGGMGGMLAQLGAFFKMLGVAAAEALAPLLPYIGIAAGVLALGAAIDIVVRNFGHLGDVLDVVTSSAKFLGQFLLDGLLRADLAVKELQKSFFEFIGRTTGADVSSPIKNLNDGIETSKKQLDALALSAGKTMDKLDESASKVDFGAAGEALKLVKGLMADVSKTTGDAAQNAKDYNDKTRPPIANLQEQLKLLAELRDQNAGLGTDIANIGVTQVDQIKNNLALELQRLEIKRQQLLVEGKLAGKVGAQIQDQLAMEEELLRKRAAKQIEAKEHPNVVGPDNVKAISDAMGDGAGKVANSIGSAIGGISGAMTGVGSVMSAVTGVLDFVQQIIDFIPQVLNKVANIFTSLTDLPLKIVEGFNNVFKGIIKFVTDFIPNLLNMIPDLLDSLVTFLFEGLPKALESLLQKLPDVIMSLLERLPDILQRLVEGLITNAPKVAIMLIQFLIKNGPKIAIAILRTFYIELPKAVIKGIIEGGKQLIEMLKSFFSGKGFKVPDSIADIPNKLEKAAGDFGKKISKESSQLFQVKDLGDNMAAIGKTETLGNAAKDAGDYLDKKFKNLWQYLKDAWQWVWDKILSPIINLIKAAWSWVWDNVLSPIVNLVRDAWLWVYDNIIHPFIEGLNTVWRWVNDNIMMPFVHALQAVWRWVNGTILQPLYGIVVGAWSWVNSNIIGPLRSIGQTGFGWVYDNVVKPLQAVGSTFSNFHFPEFHWPEIKFEWPSLPEWHWPDMPSLGGGGGGNGNVLTNGTLDPTQWSRGGMVRNYYAAGGIVESAKRGITYAARGMFVPRGVDTIPAMVAPGEFIVSAKPAQQNLPLLRAINNGQTVNTGSSVVIENITINSNSKADADMIRREVIPAIERSLKRKSQDGEFVLSKNGVR